MTLSSVNTILLSSITYYMLSTVNLNLPDSVPEKATHPKLLEFSKIIGNENRHDPKKKKRKNNRLSKYSVARYSTESARCVAR